MIIQTNTLSGNPVRLAEIDEPQPNGLSIYYADDRPSRAEVRDKADDIHRWLNTLNRNWPVRGCEWIATGLLTAQVVRRS